MSHSASQIDPSVIVDNEPVSKEDVRQQFQTAKDEITALNVATALARRMAYDDAQFDTL